MQSENSEAVRKGIAVYAIRKLGSSKERNRCVCSQKTRKQKGKESLCMQSENSEAVRKGIAVHAVRKLGSSKERNRCVCSQKTQKQ